MTGVAGARFGATTTGGNTAPRELTLKILRILIFGKILQMIIGMSATERLYLFGSLAVVTVVAWLILRRKDMAQ